MSLSTSNTYITPTNTTSIGIARGQINGSLRAILQNFYSRAAPVNTNISDDGATVDPYPGTLYMSSNSFALYRMSESTVSGGYYSTQKFTRRGVSYRVEIDSTSATANLTSGYEIGETYFRLDNNTYWFRDSTGTAVQFQTGAAASIGDGTVTPAKLAAGSYIEYNTSGQLALNNAIATSATVRTDAILSIRGGTTQFPDASIFLEPSSFATSKHIKMDIDSWSIRQDYNGNNTRDFALYDKTAAALRLYMDTSGRLGVGSSTSLTSTFTVGGTMTASGITTLTSTTATTSTTTGALVVSGGAGIASNVFVGGNVAVGTGSAARGRFDIFGSSMGGITTLTDAATVTPDFSSNNYFSLTFTSGVGNSRTIANPTNLVAGQSGIIYLIQDATGGRSVSWGSYYKFPGGTAPNLTGTGNSNDAIAYSVRSSTAITCQAILGI